MVSGAVCGFWCYVWFLVLCVHSVWLHSVNLFYSVRQFSSGFMVPVATVVSVSLNEVPLNWCAVS